MPLTPEQDLLKALKIIKHCRSDKCLPDTSSLRAKRSRGICNLLSTLIPDNHNNRHDRDTWTLFHLLVAVWPGNSGYAVYPVPAPISKKATAGVYFQRAAHYWEGAYGRKRKHLLDFLIERLEEIIAGEYAPPFYPEIPWDYAPVGATHYSPHSPDMYRWEKRTMSGEGLVWDAQLSVWVPKWKRYDAMRARSTIRYAALPVTCPRQYGT